MHSRFIGLVLVVLAMVTFAACAPKRSSNTAEDARARQTCTWTDAGWDCSYRSTEQFNRCLSRNTPVMGSPGAESFCQQLEDSAKRGAQPVVVPGAMPGNMNASGVVVGSGGHFPGYAASAPIFLPDPTPIGVINTQNSGGGGYMVPGAPATGGATSNEDVIDLGRATVAQRRAFCKRFPTDPFCCTPAH